MIETIAWLLVIEALGLAALPLALWLFRALPDRGVAFAKPLGLLGVGYVVWLGAAFGVLRHTQSTALAALLCLGAICWLGLGSGVLARLREQRRAILGAEGVFLAGFALAALLRAGNPEIFGTEKPMDFAFLNAALRDEGVPPQDPWLSGYGISYYYFGYFLLALVAKTAAVPGAVAFNLALATLFGLTAAGAYGLVSNLVAGRQLVERAGQVSSSAYGLLAAVLVLLLANLEGLLEVLHVNDLLPVHFWQWLGIKDLTGASLGSNWYPTDPPDTWWWWRASRVVGDFDLANGATRDYTINEFPFFSFLLGDLHPHVMSLPFLFLALALTLALLREPAEVSLAWARQNPGRVGLYVLAFGALGFLNSWDLPTFSVILVLAATAQRARVGSLTRMALVGKAFGLGLFVVLAAIVTYAPFYIGFRTQASGLGLVGVRTKIQHFFVVWAPLLITAGAFPLYLAFAGRRAYRALAGAGAGLALIAVVGLLFLDESSLRRLLGDVASVPGLLQGATTALLIACLLIPAGLAYWRAIGPHTEGGQRPASEDVFVLIVVGAALGLLAVCEVLFIRDGFGNRMNTVFKFYYQAWVLLAAAAAYTLYYLDLRRRLAGWSGLVLGGYRLWRTVAALVLVCGFIYTGLAPLSKVGQSAGGLTLDGLAWLRDGDVKEYEAIAWLNGREGSPVILEASGGAYSDFNRVAAFTGLPSVLGWAGHEYQWRGQTPEPAQRKADIDTIYQTPDAATAERLLAKYDVTYVYVGPRERQVYANAPNSAFSKFARLGEVVFQNERVTVYRLKG